MDFRTESKRLRALSLALGGLAARRPLPVLAAIAVVTLALAGPASRIDYSDDVLSFLPEAHPEVSRFRDLGERFGGLSVAVVGVAAPEGDLFTAPRLGLVRQITRALSRVEGVGFSSSLTELRDISVGQKDGEDVAVVSELVGDLPAADDAAAWGALRKRVLS